MTFNFFCNPNILKKLISEENKDWVNSAMSNANLMGKTHNDTKEFIDNIKMWYSFSMLEFSEVLDLYEYQEQVSFYQ